MTEHGNSAANFDNNTQHLAPEYYTSPPAPHLFRPGQVLVRCDGLLQVPVVLYPDGFSSNSGGPGSEKGFVGTVVRKDENGYIGLGSGSTETSDINEVEGTVLTPFELAHVQIQAQGISGGTQAFTESDERKRGKAKFYALITAEQCIADRIVRGEPVSDFARDLDSARQQRVKKYFEHQDELMPRPNYANYANIDINAVIAAASGEDCT